MNSATQPAHDSVHRRCRAAPPARRRHRCRDRARARPLPVHPRPGGARVRGGACEFCGARHAVTCASGTDALVLALRASGIGPGDAVICPSFTFCATAEVVALVGATPVFVDVDAATLQYRCQGHRRRDRDREARGAHAEGDHPGRSVRPAGRPRRASPPPPRREACSCSTTRRKRSARPSRTAGSALSAM